MNWQNVSITPIAVYRYTMGVATQCAPYFVNVPALTVKAFLRKSGQALAGVPAKPLLQSPYCRAGSSAVNNSIRIYRN